MSDFSGYEKMPDSLKKLNLDERDFAGLEKLKWVVTEKIHGANFSFIYEDGRLRFAKRKEYLSWQDDFFGFQVVVSKLENQIINLFEQLSSEIAAKKYIIYGELFGGEYPHPEVAPDPNVQAIQTGVYYSPSIEFCAFDIAIERDGEVKYYMDYQTAISWFESNNILHVKPLFIGKLGEALNFDTRINSTVPNELFLPSLEANLIEGVVIKPFNQKNTEGIKQRPILKLKNPEFDEEKKFHEAQKWSYIPDISSNTEELTFLIDEIRNYITDNRLASAVSKLGKLDFSNPERVSEIERELLTDTLADFNENNDNLLDDLTVVQRGWIESRIKMDVVKLMNSAGDENK